MPILTNTHIGRLTSIVSWRIPVMFCIGLYSTVLHGQTLFQPHDTIPAVSRYRSVEECLAAVSRVSDSAALARPEFPDTMPFKKGEGRDSVPAAVIVIARQCSAKFHPDSVVLTGAVETYTNWMQLYLTANRDDAAAVIAQRRIMMARQQQPNSSRALYDVLMAVMETYGNIRPMRWDNVQATGAQLESPGVAPDPIALYHVFSSQYYFAETVDDTIVQTDMAKRMLALAEAMPLEIKNTRQYQEGVRYMNFVLLNFLSRSHGMDSLRRGPEAYVAHTLGNWRTAQENQTITQPPFMVGEKALPVTAEFWFPSSTAALATQPDHLRPSPGKVALVVFLRQGCNDKTPHFTGTLGLDRATMNKRCWGTYASLRRLGQRFPWLEITLVAKTAGYIGDTGPMPPQDEALVLQKWWLGFHRLPGALAVANTEFFRLEGADRRRIDHRVPNDVNYLFGQEQWAGNEVWNGVAYLIDTNGMVLYMSGLDPKNEWTFDEMLSVIGQRGK